MPEMKFNCKYCGQPLEAPNDMLGEIIDCPKCQRCILIPESKTIIHFPSPPPLSNTKQCPFCGETIQLLAKKCKHCSEILTPDIENHPKQTKSQTIPVPKRIACPFCAEIILESAKKCKHCGGMLNGSEKRILPLLILAIFLGIFGIHAFYAGRWGQGIIYIVLLCTFWLGIPLLLLCAFLFGDLIRILIGAYKDADGNKITQWT